MLPRRGLSPTVWSPYVTGSSSNPQSFVMFYNPNIPDYSESGGLTGQPYSNWSPINSLSLSAFYATYQQYSGGGTVRARSTNSPQADLLQSEWACIQNCTYFFSTVGASQ